MKYEADEQFFTDSFFNVPESLKVNRKKAVILPFQLRFLHLIEGI